MNERAVIASGRSMAPLIRHGMRVTLQELDPASLAVGDIIAFSRDNLVVLHRILERRGDELREKGDNSRVGSWVKPADIVGKALRAEGDGVIIRFEAPADSKRLGWIVRLSRWEDAIFSVLGRVPSWMRRGILGVASLGFSPLRFIASRFMSIYPREAAREDEARLGDILQVFRTLASPTEHAASRPIDWENLRHALYAHGLESLAASLEPSFKPMRHRTGLIHLAAEATLVDVSRALSPGAIPFAVLKGPPLALALYGEPGLRSFADVDVIVAPADRARALDALVAAGFRVVGSALNQALVKRGHFHVVLKHESKNRITLELHWELVDRGNLYRIREDEIRKRWTHASLHGAVIGVLAPEDELIYLLLHIAKHGMFNGYGLERGASATWFVRTVTGNRLIWFMDIQRFLEKRAATLDWDAVRERSNRWNVMQEVFQSLEILDLLLPGAEASAALKKLKPGFVPQPRPEVNAVELPASLARWMRAEKNLIIRPARFLQLGQLLFPGQEQLRKYHEGSKLPLPLLAIVHPFGMMRRLAGFQRRT